MKKTKTLLENTNRVGVYVRVSTVDQHLENQIPELEDYLKYKKWIGAEWFMEKISGRKESRPERDRLLQLCRIGKIQTVVVWKLSRWGRSAADGIATLNEIHQLGVNFISMTESIDLSNAAGRAMAGMLAVFAELDRENMKDQMWLGRLRYKSKHGNLGGRKPTAMAKAKEVIMLVNGGMSKYETAKRLGISPSSVGRIMKAHNESKV